MQISPWAAVLWAVFIMLTEPVVLLSLLLAAVCHELGHYAVIRFYRVGVSEINFTVFGAEMRLRGRMRYGQEMAVTAAGAAVNMLLALLFAQLGARYQMFYIFSGAQALLGAFNLLPVKPLDGGQLLWLAVAYSKEPYTADRLCAIVSAAVSFSFLLLAVWLVRCGRGGCFLLLGALLLSYHAMGEKGLVKRRKNK